VRGGVRRALNVRPVRRLVARTILPALTFTTAKLALGLAADGSGGPASAKAAPHEADKVVEAIRVVLGVPHKLNAVANLVDVAELPNEAVRTALLLDREDDADTPIIAGPWLSEVGFELLYWIPFLRWATADRPEIANRLIVGSRGGAGHWYKDISGRYVDVFDHLSPDEFRERREQTALRTRAGRMEQKQVSMSTFEREIVHHVRQTLGLPEMQVLHPSLMYQALRQFRRHDAVRRVQRLSRYRPMSPPDLGPLAGALPEDYVAVRFYFSPSFPETAENRRFVASVLETLTRHTNVVLLNTGLRLDDHWDFESEAGRSHRLFRIDHLLAPSNNLHIQTIAISRARAFVGTYGGLSYLPPFLRVPSLSFYSDSAGFIQDHLDLAQRVFRGPAWGPFVALDTKQVDLVRWASAIMLRGSGLDGKG